MRKLRAQIGNSGPGLIPAGIPARLLRVINPAELETKTGGTSEQDQIIPSDDILAKRTTRCGSNCRALEIGHQV